MMAFEIAKGPCWIAVREFYGPDGKQIQRKQFVNYEDAYAWSKTLYNVADGEQEGFRTDVVQKN